MRALIALTLLLTVGCAAPAPEPEPVAFVVAGRQNAFVREMTAGYAAGVRRVGGVRHAEVGPDLPDSAAELRVFDEHTATHRGGLSIFTLSPELFADRIGRATSAGTDVVAVYCPPAPGSGITLFIGNDNHELGVLLARQVAGRIPKDSTGMIVLGSSAPGVPVLDLRASGLREELARLRPGVRLLGPFDTAQDMLANLRAWRTLRAANPDALAYLGLGGQDAHNLAEVAEDEGDWFVGAIGIPHAALHAVENGRMVLVSPEAFVQGAVAGRLQATAVRLGAALPTGWLVTPGLVIDATNVADIIDRQASVERRDAWSRRLIDDMVYRTDAYLRSLDRAML